MNSRKIKKYPDIRFFLLIILVVLWSGAVKNVDSQATGNVVGISKTITTKIDTGENCTYRWFCTNWLPAECPENGLQERECTNAGDCSDEYQKPVEKRGCEAKIPSQLFDIKLELEENIIYNSGELVAWIRFESFGREPTPVELTYILLDKEGNEIYSKTGKEIVETEKFVVEKFDDLNLDYGKYTLLLKTLYNIDVEDEFRQQFEIKNPRKILNYSLIILSALIFTYLVVRLIKEIKKEQK